MIRSHRSTLGLCALLVALSGSALAQQQPGLRVRGQGWGLLAHQTVGAGRSALWLQLGYPGLNLHAFHGVQAGFDLGARLCLNYRHEGIVVAPFPELKLDFLGRYKLLEGERVGIAVNFGLGFSTTFAATVPDDPAFGLSIPVGVAAGFPIGSALVASFTLDMPLLVVMGAGGGLSVPVLAGAGLEYFVDQTMLITLVTKMGPAFEPRVRISQAEFALQAQLGVALRL